MRSTAILLLVLSLFAPKTYGKQWIIFYADAGQVDHPTQYDTSKSGHAFISFVKEDPAKRQTLVECWGFYPETPGELGVFGYVNGAIRNDMGRQRELGFMMEVTLPEFNACIKTKDLWVNLKYSITNRNCVDFLKAIVNTLNKNRATGKPKLVQPAGLYVFPSEYVKMLKLLNSALVYQYPVELPAPEQTGLMENTPEEKQAVKQGAINFFKWHERVWENESMITMPKYQKVLYDSVLITGVGKRKKDEGCPCRVNWPALERFFSWVRKEAPVISESYLKYYRSQMKAMEPRLKAAGKDDEEIGEEFFEAFHFIPGNGGAPDYSKSGLFTNAAVWNIRVISAVSAEVKVSFKMPKNWGGAIQSYKIQMVKENNVWKLARNIEEDL